MITPETLPEKRRFTPYLIGALLSYIFCVVTFGRVFGAGAAWDFGVAATGALFFWPFLALGHGLLQWLIWLVIKNVWERAKNYRMLIVNIPIVLLTIFSGISAKNEPETAFRHFLGGPIPKSVRITQFSRSQGIGEPMRLGLAFRIEQRDLTALLATGGYIPAQNLENKNPVRWESGSCGIHFDESVFRTDYVSTNHAERHLLIPTNNSEVIFYYAPPYK